MEDTPAKTHANEQLVHALSLMTEIFKAREITSDIPPELAELPQFSELRAYLIDFREFLLAMSVGDLSVTLSRKGYLAGALKALHSSLRHLTWQTGMIASGDFSQRVDFMGAFSESFNQMVLQLEESRHKLEVLSRTDSLTGCNNRGYFMELLKKEIERSRRYGRCLSLMMFDLDHFKQVNDSYGHGAGDEALRTFVRTLQQSRLRQSDFWGRLGGEEFALALPETGLHEALVPAERIRSLLEAQPINYGSDSFRITVSIGVSHYQAGDTEELLLNCADQAMYEAKQTGRNRVCLVQRDGERAR